MIDFHNHLIPAVDDGAADLAQARDALAKLVEQGVHTVVTTPHLAASLCDRADALDARLAEIGAGWDRLRALAAAEFPALRLERGAEVMLDTPLPDLRDPRTRLAGTSFALVEFPQMLIPVNADQPLFHLKRQGWTPVIAHPERYMNLSDEDEVAQWRRVGALIQVNAGSLLGRYGDGARARAWRLLERGWVDYLSSDHHARGRVALAEARAALEARGGGAHADLLLHANAQRLLAGQAPLEVPPLAPPPSLWRRIFSRG